MKFKFSYGWPIIDLIGRQQFETKQSNKTNEQTKEQNWRVTQPLNGLELGEHKSTI